MGRNPIEASEEEENLIWYVRCADLTTRMLFQQALASGSDEKYHTWSCGRRTHIQEEPNISSSSLTSNTRPRDLAMSTP